MFLKNVIASCLVLSSVTAYENAYDLLERRRLYEPRYFHPIILYDNSNNFARTRNPHFGYINPFTSAFGNGYDSLGNGYNNLGNGYDDLGNGYDNLGNGIPVGRSRPFRPRDRRLQRPPFKETAFSDFGFHDYSHWMSPRRDYVSDHSDRHRPVLHRALLTPGRTYSNEYASKENADLAGRNRFLQKTEDKEQKKSDEVHQRSHEGAKMDSAKRERSGEELHTDQMGENKSSVTSNKIVKKGRTTKGFAVHHHKDETGNSTTFFDETSDYGGQSDLRDIFDGFGSKRILEQSVHKGDEKYFKENGGQTKDYRSGLLLGDQRFEKDFSSMGDHEQSEGKFHSGSESDGFGPQKTYRYLNGDPFDFAEEEVHQYY